MAHLNSSVYLRALGQGLKLLQQIRISSHLTQTHLIHNKSSYDCTRNLCTDYGDRRQKNYRYRQDQGNRNSRNFDRNSPDKYSYDSRSTYRKPLAKIKTKFHDRELERFNEEPKRDFIRPGHTTEEKIYVNLDEDISLAYKSRYKRGSFEGVAIGRRIDVNEEDKLEDTPSNYQDEENFNTDVDEPDVVQAYNYRKHGSYKNVRFDERRIRQDLVTESAPTRQKFDENLNANDNIVDYEEKPLGRNLPIKSQEDTDDPVFGNCSQSRPNTDRVWQKSYGSLSEKKYDRKSEEAFDDKTDVKPHRRLSATDRRNVPYWYSLQMKKFAKQGKIKEAIDVFEVWMLKRDRVLPDYYTFGVLISILAKAGLTKKAFQIYNKMKKMGLYADAHVYSALFNACANSPWKSDCLERAQLLKQTMEDKEFTPNYITSTAMIKAFGKGGDLTTCFAIMDDICVKYPDQLEASAFSTLMSTCLTDKQNGFKLTIEVWQKMQELKIRPNNYIYNLLLKAVRYCDFDYRKDLLPNQHTDLNLTDGHALKTESSKDESVNKTENSLISREELPNLLVQSPSNMENVLAKVDFSKLENKLALIGGVDSVLEHMKSNQVHPDIRIFSLFLDCAEQKLEAEEKLLQTMKEYSMKPDVEFCNSLIRKRALRRDKKNARGVVQLMIDSHLKLNMESFKCLALTCSTPKEGLKLLEDIEEMGSEPTLEVFSNLINGSYLNYFYKTELLIRMEKLRIKPDKKLLANLEKNIVKGKQYLLKREQEVRKSVYADKKLAEFQTGFKKFMTFYKDWLKRTDISVPEHPYDILRKEKESR